MHSDGSITLSSANLNVLAVSVPTKVEAGADLTITTTGNVMVQGGSATDASATISGGPGIFTGTVGGDFTIQGGSGQDAFALVRYDPDIGTAGSPLTIGGKLFINAGSGAGAFGRLEAVSNSTIYLEFSNLASGGYVVNGTEGLIEQNGSGIFAGGAPAVLSSNFLVQYDLLPPPPPPPPSPAPPGSGLDTNLLAPITQAATDAGNPGHTGTGTGIGTGAGTGTPEEEEKKELPVCR